MQMSESRLAKILNAFRVDILARLGCPTRQIWTENLNDKWVFSNEYLSDLSSDLNMESIKAYPAQENLNTIFEDSFNSFLRDSGNSDIVVPGNIRSLICQRDASINLELKKNICPTGIIVMKK
jgi:hypothetical protein